MADKKDGKASSEAMARVLRNQRGSGSREARLHDLRPLAPSAEYVALANQALGQSSPMPAGEPIMGGYDIAPAPDAVAAIPMLAAPATPSAEYVARAAQAMGRPGMGPQTVSMGAELEAAGRPTPLNMRQKAPAFRGAVAQSETVDPQLLAALLRAGR